MGLARARRLRVTGGVVGGVLADEARVMQTAAQGIAARERVEMDQAAAGVVVSRHVNATQSLVGVLVAGRVEGDEVRVLFGPAAALAFGAGVGAVLGLLGWLRAR